MSAASGFRFVRLETVAPRVTLLTLDRPEKRNAFHTAMRDEMGEAFARIRADRDVGVLILTGAGDTFCAGGDIGEMAAGEMTAEAGRNRLMDLAPIAATLHMLEIPVIAAVDGFAYGAGFNIALAADFIVATPAARFSQSFARVGLVPDFGGLYILPRLVGLARARELVYTGREVGAEEARELGIVSRIVSRDVLMPTVVDMAERLTAASPTALAQAKQILRSSLQEDLQTVLEREAAAQGICLSSDYHRAAVGDFVNRRAPGFAWDG